MMHRMLSRAVPAQVVQARAMGIQYKAPVRDIKFVIDEVLDGDAHFEKNGFTEATSDLRHSITEECAKFAEEELSPISQRGDTEGCSLDPKTTDVRTPSGWKDAYENFAAAGWVGLSVPEKYGGQGLPQSLGMIKSELVSTANWAWGMYPGLSVGCMNTLILCANEEQKSFYLPKLSEGIWSGTMCLTEPHCGTDLGQVETTAVKQGDGSYKLSGTKIFISCGEHDWTDNIIHIVLARVKGGPPGTKGLSLFIVPKYLSKSDGSLEDKKNLVCGSVEKKMGIHGSSTCVMNFDESTGYLIGNENDGMEQMFVFMNTARIGTAIQGLASAELALQGALPYARDRKSMRSLSGKKSPNQVADSILEHGDVRRMLLTCRAIAEGARCMIYDAALMGDTMLQMTSASQRKEFEENMGFLTPILKGFLTETGFECANLGMQVLGGHGFIKEWGLEQNVRDSRIATLYEGTTGIQALDLLGRKVFIQKGKAMNHYTKEIFKYTKKQLWDNREHSKHKMEALKVTWYTLKWYYALGRIGHRAFNDSRDAISTASVHFLMYSGYTSMAYYWLRMMDTAAAKLAQPDLPESERSFYKGKIQTGKFYFDYLLPRADSYLKLCGKSPKSVMSKDAFAGLDY